MYINGQETREEKQTNARYQTQQGGGGGTIRKAGEEKNARDSIEERKPDLNIFLKERICFDEERKRAFDL